MFFFNKGYVTRDCDFGLAIVTPEYSAFSVHLLMASDDFARKSDDKQSFVS